MNLRPFRGLTAATVGRMTLTKPPIATLAVLSITGVVTGLQFVYRPLLACLERTPAIFSQHQWWRLVTPLFVHDEGWVQIAFNFPSILIVGTLAERIWGSRRWLAVYFICGLVGELAGCAWKPFGAGASLAGAGLLGSLAPWLLYKVELMRAKFGAAVILLGAAVLTFFHDLHGPPILVGACFAFAMLKAQPSETASIKSDL